METTLEFHKSTVEYKQKLEEFIRQLHLLQQDITNFIERNRLIVLLSKLKI